MKKSTVIQLVVAAAAVLVIAWLLRSGEHKNAPAAGGDAPGNAGFEVGEAAEVRVRGADGAVTLASESGAWVVRERAGFAADVAKLAGILRGFSSLKPVQAVDVPENRLDRLGLVAPELAPGREAPADDVPASVSRDGRISGLRLTVLDSDGNTLAEWIVGNEYFPEAGAPMGGMQSGRYYRTAGEPSRVILAGDVARGLTAAPADWLDKALLLPDVEIARIESKPAGGEAEAWVAAVAGEGEHAPLELEGLKEGESLKPGVLSSIAGQLERLRFDDVQVAAGGSDAAATVFDPVSTVRVESRDGTVFELFFAAEADGFTPLRITKTAGEKSDGSPDAGTAKSGDTVYLVRTFALGQLLSPRADLLQPPPSPAPAEAGGGGADAAE